MPSYIPSKEADFLDWSANLIAVSKANKVEWNLPEAQLTGLDTLHNEVMVLHEKCKTASCTRLDMQAKNEKLKALKKDEQVFVRNNLQNNDAMTDNGRAALRIPIYDRKPTPHPAPSIQPETDAAPSGSRKHTVMAVNPETKSKKKPPLVKGVAFAHKLRLPDEPRAEAEEMPSFFQAETVHDFQWKEADIGKVADYATAYENEGFVRGSWSNVVSVIVA